MSQRGLYGMRYIPIASAAPGTRRARTSSASCSQTPLKPQSTMYAIRIPIMIISWLNETTPPRIRGGTSSAMYIGDTNDAVPTASPSQKRAARISQYDCENARRSAPIT